MLAVGLVGLGAVATYTDLRARLIPNWLTGAGALGVLVWRVTTGTWATGLVGAGMAVVVLGLASLASRHPRGGGAAPHQKDRAADVRVNGMGPGAV